jgi:hypothetical protein
MALNYTSLGNLATKVIKTFGGEITITYADGSTAITSGVVEDKVHRQRGDGGQITVTGVVKHLYIGAVKKPEPLDLVLSGATNYRINAVNEVNPGGTALMYDCELQ